MTRIEKQRSIPKIVEPYTKKRKRKSETGFIFKVISESKIDEIYVDWFSEKEAFIKASKSTITEFDEKEYKMLCLGCFRKKSNFFDELRKAIAKTGISSEIDDSSPDFKLSLKIDQKEYNFYRVTDDGAQVNLRDYSFRRK